MRLDDLEESGHVEDSRGRGLIGGRSIGIGTIAIALVAMYFGVDPNLVLNIAQQVQPPERSQAAPADNNDPNVKLFRVCCGAPSKCGKACFQPQGGSTHHPTWRFLEALPKQRVGKARQPWGRFIVRPTKRSISI